MGRLRQVLREELGLEPSSWVENLHQSIRDGGPPAQGGPGDVSPPAR